MGEESGYGLFVASDAKTMRSPRKKWWWPFGAAPPFATVAIFPMSSALTAANILADPQVQCCLFLLQGTKTGVAPPRTQYDKGQPCTELYAEF